MNRILFVAFFLLLITALVFWSYQSGKDSMYYQKLSIPKIKNIIAPVEEPVLPDNNKPNVLNLALPEKQILVDPMIVMPERQHQMADLFKPEEKESGVKIGGGLILDEKPLEPNAGVWDKVKGAEVGITIKTP